MDETELPKKPDISTDPPAPIDHIDTAAPSPAPDSAQQEATGILRCHGALIAPKFDQRAFIKGIREMVADSAKKHEESKNVIILYDEGTLHRTDADRIYEALKARPNKTEPVRLILHSPGGSISAGYFISKLCREYSAGNFEVVVPRFAKSAATLICCGANRVHMGSLSELGPIDPQINNLPALGLKSSVEHIAELANQYPNSASMFAEYLSSVLNVQYIGYYERVAQSAEQYASRLLAGRVNDPEAATRIARQLVHEYKDHGFVLDAHEVSTIFGSDFVVRDSSLYAFANAVYGDLAMMKAQLRLKKFSFFLTGALDSEPVIYQIPDPDFE